MANDDIEVVAWIRLRHEEIKETKPNGKLTTQEQKTALDKNSNNNRNNKNNISNKSNSNDNNKNNKM